MKVRSRGLGRKELIMDLRRYDITREGDDVMVSGTITEPVTWDFSIRMSPGDIPGMVRVAVSRETFLLGLRWILGMVQSTFRRLFGARRTETPSSVSGQATDPSLPSGPDRVAGRADRAAAIAAARAQVATRSNGGSSPPGGNGTGPTAPTGIPGRGDPRRAVGQPRPESGEAATEAPVRPIPRVTRPSRPATGGPPTRTAAARARGRSHRSRGPARAPADAEPRRTAAAAAGRRR